MKNLWKEFKEFIARGNIVDLSVAVIIGAAFSSIVTALTDKIIMPLVNCVLAICGGKDGLESAYTILNAGYTDGELDLSKSVYIDWGAFVAAVLNFFIIAVVVFLIIKFMNKAQMRLKKLENTVLANAKKDLLKEKLEIRKQAREENRPFKQVWKEHLDKKALENLEKEKQEAEKKAQKEAEEKANNPTQEDLLKDIKELLQKQVENKKTNKKK